MSASWAGWLAVRHAGRYVVDRMGGNGLVSEAAGLYHTMLRYQSYVFFIVQSLHLHIWFYFFHAADEMGWRM